MPPRATELHHISSSLLIWHAFDRAAKTELFSTAIITHAGTIVIDPIALTDLAEQELNKRPMQITSVPRSLFTNGTPHRFLPRLN